MRPQTASTLLDRVLLIESIAVAITQGRNHLGGIHARLQHGFHERSFAVSLGRDSFRAPFGTALLASFGTALLAALLATLLATFLATLGSGISPRILEIPVKPAHATHPFLIAIGIFHSLREPTGKRILGPSPVC